MSSPLSVKHELPSSTRKRPRAQSYDSLNDNAKRNGGESQKTNSFGDLATLLYVLKDVPPTKNSHKHLTQQVVALTVPHRAPLGELKQTVSTLKYKLQDLGATNDVLTSFENLFPWACGAYYLSAIAESFRPPQTPKKHILEGANWFRQMSGAILEELEGSGNVQVMTILPGPNYHPLHVQAFSQAEQREIRARADAEEEERLQRQQKQREQAT